MVCDFPIFDRGFPSQPCLITSPKNRAVDIGCRWTQNGPHFSPAKNQCVRRLMLFSQISADVWTWHNIHNTYGNSQISQRPPAIRPSKLQGESKFHNDRGCVQFLRWKSLAELRMCCGSMTSMNRARFLRSKWAVRWEHHRTKWWITVMVPCFRKPEDSWNITSLTCSYPVKRARSDTQKSQDSHLCSVGNAVNTRPYSPWEQRLRCCWIPLEFSLLLQKSLVGYQCRGKIRVTT